MGCICSLFDSCKDKPPTKTSLSFYQEPLYGSTERKVVPYQRPQPTRATRPQNRALPTNSSSGPQAVLVAQQVGARVIPQFYMTTWILDTSGSMAGNKWRLVQEGVRSILNEMNEMDFVVARDDVDIIGQPALKGDSDLQRQLGFVRPSGGTALYDSIIKGVLLSITVHRQMDEQIRPYLKPLLIVITDGEDTSSKGTIQEAEMALSQLDQSDREWAMLLLGIGLASEGKSKVQRLARAGGDHTKFIDIANNAQEIQGVFQRIALVLQQRTVIIAAS